MTAPALGLLFDLDGTMANSDPAHFAAFNALLAPHGRSIDQAEFHAHIVGGANAQIMRRLFPELDEAAHRELADRKEALFRASGDRIEPIAGLHALLARMAAAGVPVGVVTNAPRRNAEHMLGALGLAHLLDTVVIGEEVGRGKPDPLPYCTGLERLGLPANRVIAFEDSRAGIRSATGAGLFTVGMTTNLPAEALREAGAGLTAPDFEDPALLALIDTRLAA